MHITVTTVLGGRTRTPVTMALIITAIMGRITSIITDQPITVVTMGTGVTDSATEITADIAMTLADLGLAGTALLEDLMEGSVVMGASLTAEVREALPMEPAAIVVTATAAAVTTGKPAFLTG